MRTNKKFCITFIYGLNHEQQRRPLWNDLYDIAQNMSSAWSGIGDFNSVLYRADKQGGNDLTDHKLEDMANFTETCEL